MSMNMRGRIWKAEHGGYKVADETLKIDEWTANTARPRDQPAGPEIARAFLYTLLTRQARKPNTCAHYC